MNSDFPRIITLLRKERGVSQKKAAADLGISQALLSHYEKGIRECGLEFLVKTADYYNVSCDYLLGRSPEPAGKTISYDDIPEADMSGKEKIDPGGVMAAFNKKLVVNAVSVLFSLVKKTGSPVVLKEVSAYLMLAVYKMFRVVYSANPKNDKRFFTIEDVPAAGSSAAAMAMCEANASAAAASGSAGDETLITANSLSEEYSSSASSLLNVIKNSEARMQVIINSDK